MMSVHEQHHFYTRPGHLPVVHSPISDKPFQVMKVLICAGLVDWLDYINLICYVGGEPSRHSTVSKILFLFCLENSALRYPCDAPLHSASGGGCWLPF